MKKLILVVVAVFLLSSAPCQASGFVVNVFSFNAVRVDNGFSSTVAFVPNNRVFFSNDVVIRQQNVVIKEVVRERPVVIKQKTVIRRGLFR